MSYLNESRLSAYNSKLKEWISSQNSKTITPSIYPWTKTAKASTVSCYPVGGTELKPVVDFLFTETPPASGNKGPENPSTISGVSSVTVTLCETAGVDSTDYTVILDSTYYGGTLDVASGVMTVTWGSLTFSSVNNFQGDNGTCVRFAHAYPVQAYTHYSSEHPDFFACEMFPVVTGTPQSEEFCRAGGSGLSGSQSATFSILKSRLDVSGAADPSNLTTAEWLTAINAWLAEHPVTYYFKLYYPYTVQLSPTQILSLAQPDKYMPRLNTIYTNAQDVQVGYVKSPIREEYELQQAIVSQGGNI